jgi:hypothetical protein
MAAIGSGRLQDFETYLRSNAIPFTGISNPDSTSENLVIDFTAEATAEQISFATDAITTFDWRKRRMIARNTIVNTLASLATAQQNAILRHVCAAFIRANKAEALDILATLQQNVPIDEVDPNP